MILLQKVKRISVSLIQKRNKTNPDFLSQFLTPAEIRYCESKRHFAEPAAARLAAKKACLSLFEIPVAQWAKWLLQIQIEKKNTGQPFLKFSARLKKKLGITKDQRLLLSLAHERELAIAWVALVTDAVPRGSVSELTPPRGTASGVRFICAT